MITVILLVLFLGAVLGLSIGKLNRIKDFQFFNTWFMFFACTLLLFIPVCTFFLVNGVSEMLAKLTPRTIKAILVPSLFGGIGLFLFANSIRKSDYTHSILLFLLSVLIGIAARDFIFVSKVFSFLALGVPVIAVFLWFLIIPELDFYKMTLPVFAGLAASGFAVVFDIEPQTILSLGQSFDNGNWQVYLFKIALASAGASVILLPIFLAQMGQKNAWVFYDTPYFWQNSLIIAIIAVLVTLSLFGFSYSFQLPQNGVSIYLLNLFFTGITLGSSLLLFKTPKVFRKQLAVIAIILLSLNLGLILGIV